MRSQGEIIRNCTERNFDEAPSPGSLPGWPGKFRLGWFVGLSVRAARESGLTSTAPTTKTCHWGPRTAGSDAPAHRDLWSPRSQKRDLGHPRIVVEPGCGDMGHPPRAQGLCNALCCPLPNRSWRPSSIYRPCSTANQVAGLFRISAVWRRQISFLLAAEST